MIEHFKMCRITCDNCHRTNFEVFTFDDYVDAPITWKRVTSYGWGASGYTRMQLCCPDCVENLMKDHDVKIADAVSICIKPDVVES